MPIPGIAACVGALASEPRLIITGQNITDTQISPSNASAALNIKSNGSYSKTLSGAETSFGNWIAPAYAATFYEYRATALSGSLSSGTTGTWLSGNQTWTLLRTTLGSSTCSLQIEIRRGSGPTLKTVVFPIEANKEV